MRRSLLVALIFLPSAAMAQVPPREVMVEDWEHQRKRVLSFLDAAPDSMMGYRTTPQVRTFAEQIDHIGSSAAYVVAMTIKGAKGPPPELMAGDTAVFLHRKAALRERTNKMFDWTVAAIKSVSDADLTANVTALGNTKPRWRWSSMALEHSAFTLGQTVPYLRMHKVTPPQYLPF
jgi:hypothetical protein